jgi:hypothetical protein
VGKNQNGKRGTLSVPPEAPRPDDDRRDEIEYLLFSKEGQGEVFSTFPLITLRNGGFTFISPLLLNESCGGIFYA